LEGLWPQKNALILKLNKNNSFSLVLSLFIVSFFRSSLKELIKGYFQFHAVKPGGDDYLPEISPSSVKIISYWIGLNKFGRSGRRADPMQQQMELGSSGSKYPLSLRKCD